MYHQLSVPGKLKTKPGSPLCSHLLDPTREREMDMTSKMCRKQASGWRGPGARISSMQERDVTQQLNITGLRTRRASRILAAKPLHWEMLSVPMSAACPKAPQIFMLT